MHVHTKGYWVEQVVRDKTAAHAKQHNWIELSLLWKHLRSAGGVLLLPFQMRAVSQKIESSDTAETHNWH